MSAAVSLRRGWCPGALRPMRSGDGFIVRLKPRLGTLGIDQALGIAAAAERFGNGLLDLTGRANLQIRGADDSHLPSLTAALDDLGLIDAEAGAETRRNVVVSPLYGLDPAAAFDVRPVAAALEKSLVREDALEGLPAKFGFAVSDGGAMALGEVSADVRLEALHGTQGRQRFAVRLDGAPGWAGACDAADVVVVALRLATTVLAWHRRDPELRRMRDVVGRAGVETVMTAAGLVPEPMPSPMRDRRADAVGLVDVAPGSGTVVLGAAAAFGRLNAAQLATLAKRAGGAGAAELRLTSWRSILVPGLARVPAEALARFCAEAGLVVDPRDARLRVAACPGAPGCARGTTPVLEHAARWARRLAPDEQAATIRLHVSGCRKGCAHPGAAPLTFVAEGGRYALIAGGTAEARAIVTGLDEAAVDRLLRGLERDRLA